MFNIKPRQAIKRGLHVNYLKKTLNLMSPTANRDLIMEIIYHNVTALTGLAEMFRSEWDQGSTTSEHISPNESHTARSAWYCQTERRASGLMQWHIKTNSGKPASEDCKHAILFVTQVGIDTQQMFIEESRIRSLIQLAGSVWHHRMHLKKNVLTYCLQLKLNSALMDLVPMPYF